ncbi:PAS domain-containing protein [Maribellus sediminis]|uniref:PAS domain-containing protein n=1 Tax=Maribellus sediminis TaxID=2696285 RepID=UPI00143155CC|nr:PAS domain S-box protein [Maribellus sediminis]
MIYDKDSFLTGNIDDPEIHQKIIDTLPVPIFYRDVNGVYQMCNAAHEKFTGKTKQQIVGKSVFEVHTKEMAEKYSHQDAELLNNPDVQVYNTQVRHGDGTSHHVILNKAVIRDNEGEIVGIVGSINDITDLKMTEKRLAKAQESMEVSSQMIHKISAGIVMMDREFKVVDSNESFARLMGEEIEELYDTIPGLKGADVSGLVPEVVYKMMQGVLNSGEEKTERDLRFANKLLHVSVVTLYKNRVVGAVFRDMSAPMLVQDEIINRARRINKQNIETVQKVAFLLGENAAETEELLNSIIQTYRYGDEDNS